MLVRAYDRPEGGRVIVRIAGEGRWLLPNAAEGNLRVLDNAVALAVDEVREDEYQRLLVGLCAFVRSHGELIEEGDYAGAADMTVPPPSLSLDSTVDALFDGPGLSAEPHA
jgi:PspA-Associated protein